MLTNQFTLKDRSYHHTNCQFQSQPKQMILLCKDTIGSLSKYIKSYATEESRYIMDQANC